MRFQTIIDLPTQTLVIVLAVMSLLLMVASVYVYRYSLHVAKDRGVLDLESNF